MSAQPRPSLCPTHPQAGWDRDGCMGCWIRSEASGRPRFFHPAAANHVKETALTSATGPVAPGLVLLDPAQSRLLTELQAELRQIVPPRIMPIEDVEIDPAGKELVKVGKETMRRWMTPLAACAMRNEIERQTKDLAERRKSNRRRV